MAVPDEFSDARLNLAEELRLRRGYGTPDPGEDSGDDGGCCPPPGPFIPGSDEAEFVPGGTATGLVPPCGRAYTAQVDLGQLLHAGTTVDIFLDARWSQDHSGHPKTFDTFILASGASPSILASLVQGTGGDAEAPGDGNPILYTYRTTASNDRTDGQDGNRPVEGSTMTVTLGRDTSALSIAVIPNDCDVPWYTDGNGYITVDSFSDTDPEEVESVQPEEGQTVAMEETPGDDSADRITNYPYQRGSLDVFVDGVRVTVVEVDPDAGTFTLPRAYDSSHTIDFRYQVADTEILNNNPQATSIDFTLPGEVTSSTRWEIVMSDDTFVLSDHDLVYIEVPA